MCSHLGDCEGICGTRDGRGLGGEAVHCLVAPPAHLAQDPVTIAVRFESTPMRMSHTPSPSDRLEPMPRTQ